MTRDDAGGGIEWEDEIIARRIRAALPEESAVDLDEYAREVAQLIALAPLERVEVTGDDGA